MTAAVVYQRGRAPLPEASDWEFENQGSHLETVDVEWTSDDPDPVAISRLKKSNTPPGVLEERVSHHTSLQSS